MTTPELERVARAIVEVGIGAPLPENWDAKPFYMSGKIDPDRIARAALEALPLAEWKDALRACDCLLTSFSTTGEGPEKPGERIVTLSAVRRACAEIDHILEGK